VRGSLDKEIIRRIIRRHINEVKFCYEKELTRQANLMGRVMIQFTIAGTGNVIASIVQSSTMNSPPVEQCIAAAVRRWEFPKPQGGGIVVVTYPFVLKASGAE
jgi:TonB family protein